MTTNTPASSPSWFAHSAAQIWVGIYCTLAVVVLVAPEEVAHPIGWAAVVGIVACAIARARHGRRLCARCADEWPVDGQARAERTWAFRIHHNAVRIEVAAMTAFFAALLMTDPYSTIGRAANALLFGVYAAVLLAGRRHARLLPWCPYCRDDNGDDDAHDPTPAPDPSAAKTA